ncbi:MAG: hypothetical protein J6C96_12705, partial [Oscillospiraceae bacterium]|nr:hypothetical protein [Oscillospiraceae bacterium]
FCPFEGKKPCLGQNMMRFFTFLQEKRLFQAGREFFYLGMLFIQRFPKKSILLKNLRLYYVYDIITNFWSEGGTGKIHSAAKPNRYLQEISPRAWRTALDGYFEKSMFRTETSKIANPKSEEYVILNCIYLHTFTAMDQLSIDKFDVEHIAPKEQMKNLIAKCGGNGLPISCIANLCYLPEYVNRSKKDRNFYQDTKYLQYINLESVEQKYSFTTREDLEWMDMPFESEEDFNDLRQFYSEFCTSRFETIKRLFCEAMGIDYSEMKMLVEETLPSSTVQAATNLPDANRSSTFAFVADCISRIESNIGDTLIKRGRSTYCTQDRTKGYVFSVSKAYKQGQREKYWFAYRKNPFDDISDCQEQFIVYGCKNANEVLVFPVHVIDELTDKLNYSLEDDGSVSHWHIVFFRDSAGHMTQLLSRPELTEKEIDSFKM